LADAAADGDAEAKAVLEHSARRTGQLCGLLTDIFSPQVILLGSLVRYFGSWWVEVVRSEFALEALAGNRSETKILPSELGVRLQDLSAVAPCVFRRGAS
jgi:glucokinase